MENYYLHKMSSKYIFLHLLFLDEAQKVMLFLLSSQLV